MSAILCRDGDWICDLCIYADGIEIDDLFTCPIGDEPEVVDETAVGKIVVCESYTTKEMVE